MIVRTVGFGGGAASSAGSGGGGSSSVRSAFSPDAFTGEGRQESGEHKSNTGASSPSPAYRPSNSRASFQQSTLPIHTSSHSPIHTAATTNTSPNRRGRVGWSEGQNQNQSQRSASSHSPSRSPAVRSALRVSTGHDQDHEKNNTDLDSSRISVNFEEILSGSAQSEYVPVHDVPVPPSRLAVRYGSYNSHTAASNSGVFNSYTSGNLAYSAAPTFTSSTTNTTSKVAKLESVDQRLQELKLEKERLQRRLLDHAVR